MHLIQDEDEVRRAAVYTVAAVLLATDRKETVTPAVYWTVEHLARMLHEEHGIRVVGRQERVPLGEGPGVVFERHRDGVRLWRAVLTEADLLEGVEPKEDLLAAPW